MSKKNYILAHIILIALLTILYNHFMLRPISGMSYTQSMHFYMLIACVLTVLGILSTWEHARTGLNVFANIALPIVIYTLISCSQTAPVLTRVHLFLTVLVYELDAFKSTLRELACRRRKKLRAHSPTRITPTARVAGYCLLVGFFIGGTFVLGKYTFFPPAPTESTANKEGINIADSLDVLTPLVHEDLWDSMSANEKLNVIQSVASLEVEHLGLPFDLAVTFSDLPGYTVGFYNHSNHLITIDCEKAGPAEEVLDALCHECFHAYQSCLCDAYNESLDEQYKGLLGIRRIATYTQEFQNYSDGDNGEDDESFMAYYNQLIEHDAREYAEMTSGDYLSAISLLELNPS